MSRLWGAVAFMSVLVIGAACTSSTAEMYGDGSALCRVQGESCAVHCNPTRGCLECLVDTDCAASEPACVNGKCRQCATNTDCPSGEVCGVGECNPACSSDLECEDDERCDPTSKSCVDCLSAADCPTDKPMCSSELSCSECVNDLDCAKVKPHCETTSEAECRECLVDAHCTAGQWCVDKHCMLPCVDDQDCATLSGSHCDLELKVCLN